MGTRGMSFDVSLKDINIGMPRNMADMNMDAIGQQSLYLIKVCQSLSYMTIFYILLYLHCCKLDILL